MYFDADRTRRLHRQLHARGLPQGSPRVRPQLGTSSGSDAKRREVEDGQNGQVPQPFHGQ